MLYIIHNMRIGYEGEKELMYETHINAYIDTYESWSDFLEGKEQLSEKTKKMSGLLWL